MIRYCKTCSGWHDLDEPWPHRTTQASGVQIIKDIEPYRAVAGDVALGGKMPTIGGRAQHREFLRRNRYIEVGNEPMKATRPEIETVSRREIKEAIERSRK